MEARTDSPYLPIPKGKLAVLPQLDLNQRYSIAEASVYLRQSPSKTYSDIAAGRIKTIRDGKQFITGKEIAARSAA